ncbi:MAG: 3-phosphoshikimate 1-carboxyvinyltransferase [Flavobacteriales bacterium]|jgi:3-phosphoshikimate 1-carboxyvinyltransferase|nr:3-phosphoshikimate 1-carboxyvinyltransferase [Flavobacteriales bacterium]
MNYKISHPTKVVNCEIDLPSSKSISNRLLIIQALCKENFIIENLSDSDDTKSLELALNSKTNLIDVGAAGTTFRFLTSYLSTKVGEEFTLTGTDRMKERPIKELVDSLKELDAQIEYVEEENSPPLKIKGVKLKGKKIKIDGSVSSQFISSILLISPTIKGGLDLEIKGDLVSKPYVLMTLKLMSEFGINWDWTENKIKIVEQNYLSKNYKVESDWSAATFWFQIASLSENCNIKLNGLDKNSIQGDKKVRNFFKNLGVESEFVNNQLILTKIPVGTFPEKVDLIENPDVYQSLKCTLFSKGVTTEISGVQTLKDKETNRISAVENELKKLHQSKIIETYNDHRMAMSFAPLCLTFGELQINNPEVVSKSYPNFWEDLKKGGFKISF